MQRGCLSVENTNGSLLEASLKNEGPDFRRLELRAAQREAVRT